jgi:tRNA(fMet)-specific endonuclease VapC
MPSRFMLDTNICIYIRRMRPAPVLERFRSLARGDAVISVVTYGELRYGAEKSLTRERALEMLDEFVALVPVQPLSPPAGTAYGAIRSALEREGQVIGGNDLWIAAQARADDLTLVTNNEREFGRVPGLRIENWANDPPR